MTDGRCMVTVWCADRRTVTTDDVGGRTVTTDDVGRRTVTTDDVGGQTIPITMTEEAPPKRAT